MHAGRVETERFEALLRHLVRMDLGKPDGAHPLGTEPRQQLRETGPIIVDETAERHDVGRPLRLRSTRHVEQVCLDAVVGGNGESGDIVRDTADGKVTAAGLSGGYGRVVDIDHGNGLSTRYGHLSSIDVRVGQSVRNGQIIGKVGSTGRSTGPHLHYETRVRGAAVDPQKFLRAGQRLDGNI